MKKIVVFIVALTFICLADGCTRHDVTVDPYGWTSLSDGFDSLTRVAESLYFVYPSSDSVHDIVGKMELEISRMSGKNADNARAAKEYWRAYAALLEGNRDRCVAICDSVLSHPANVSAYCLHRLNEMTHLCSSPKSIETFKVLLDGLDFYRNIGDMTQEADMAVLISNNLQYGTDCIELSLSYMHLADSLYLLSDQKERRRNVILNEPVLLCRTGYLEEGRRKMEALLDDTTILKNPAERELMYRNHFYFFKVDSSLLKGYDIICRQINEDGGVIMGFTALRGLYEALICERYIDRDMMDSAIVFLNLSRDHYEEVYDSNIRSELPRIWAKYYRAAGRKDEALEAINLKETLLEENNEITQPQRKAFLERVNALKRHDEDTRKAKMDMERNRDIIIGTVIFVLLVVTIVFLHLRHRHRMKLMGLELEDERKQRQILALSMTKEQTDKMLAYVKDETSRLRKEDNVSARDLVEIDTNLRVHCAELSELNAFEKAFAEMSPDFSRRLKELSPSISVNNIRLCCYIYMGMTNKEISSMLNISPAALRQARKRLRERFGLTADDSLEDFLRNLG